MIILTSFCEYGFSVSALCCLSQHLPSYLGFSYLGRGVSLYSCSSTAQLLLLSLDEGYLLSTTPPDLERGVAPLGPPAPGQPEGQPRGQKQKDGQENMERAWVPGDTPEPLSLSPVELNHPDFL